MNPFEVFINVVTCPKCSDSDNLVFMDFVTVGYVPGAMLIDFRCSWCNKLYGVKICEPLLIME